MGTSGMLHHDHDNPTAFPHHDDHLDHLDAAAADHDDQQHLVNLDHQHLVNLDHQHDHSSADVLQLHIQEHLYSGCGLECPQGG